MAPRVSRTLAYFAKRDEQLAGELPLIGLELADLQRLFFQPPDNLMYDVYPVGPAQAPTLQEVFAHKLDFDQFDYFLDCHAEPETERALSPASPSDCAELEMRR